MCFDLRGQVIEAQRLQRLSLRPAGAIQVHGLPAETAAVTEDQPASRPVTRDEATDIQAPAACRILTHNPS